MKTLKLLMIFALLGIATVGNVYADGEGESDTPCEAVSQSSADTEASTEQPANDSGDGTVKPR